jgi:hypothetical protein
MMAMGRADFSAVQRTRVKAETVARLEFLLGEHVEAFGFFTHLGDFQHISRHQMGLGAPAAGSFFGLTAPGRKARAMPTALCLVLTPTQVVATTDPDGQPGPIADPVLGAWNRATTSIEVGNRRGDREANDTGVSVTLHLLEEDRPLELESLDHGFYENDQILSLLRE